MFSLFDIFNNEEEDDDMPEIHKGTIKAIPTQFSGLQTIIFTDRTPVYVENYGHRQLMVAANHLGQDSLNGMQIEFSMDGMGFVMETFQILGNETHVACYGCQKVMEKIPIKDVQTSDVVNSESNYILCAECGHVYCPECKDKDCTYCAMMGDNPDPSL